MNWEFMQNRYITHLKKHFILAVIKTEKFWLIMKSPFNQAPTKYFQNLLLLFFQINEISWNWIVIYKIIENFEAMGYYAIILGQRQFPTNQPKGFYRQL